MRNDIQYNLSPGVDLKTAEYLTDPKMSREYERLRNTNHRTESTFAKLWRMPKFRRRMLEFARLMIFGFILCWGIAFITKTGLWLDIHHAIVTAL